MGERITFKAGRLIVPDHPIIPFIEGDGIGKEITTAAHAVFGAAVAKAYPNRQIHWKEVYAGEKSFNMTKSWLPEETMQAFSTYLVGMKGPLTTPVGGGMRSLNVALRQQLDLYVCLRPVRYFKGVGSPIKHPEQVNMTIFRENTEDIYAGIEWKSGTPECDRVIKFLMDEMKVKSIRFPGTSSIGVKPVSTEGSERLVRAAVEYAIQHHFPSVTLVHKGNIMKFTEGGFKLTGYKLAEEEFGDRVFTVPQYERIKAEKGKAAADAAWKEASAAGKVIVKDCICDAFLQNTLLKPLDYSVVATMNLNGDYVSDQLAAMVGGIGIAPGANMNYASGHAIFEATHGTAPDIAGQELANPCSLLLSGVMLFEYLGWNAVGELITKAMEKLFHDGKATSDLAALMPNGQPLSTSKFTDELIKAL